MKFKMIRAAKLTLLGFLSVVFSIRHVPMVSRAYAYIMDIMHDGLFFKWFKRAVFALALSIVVYHCAQCQVVTPQQPATSDTLTAQWWRVQLGLDTAAQLPTAADLGGLPDTMDIIAILPDWETGQVETVKGRMIRQTNGVGWQFYLLRQKCQEYPRKEGKKTLYEYRCEPQYQPVEADRIANYYIKPQPRKPTPPPAPER